MKADHYWVVLRIASWENWSPSPKNLSPFPIAIDPGKMVGYCPVYATKEDALTDYPEGPVAEVRPRC